MRFSRDRIITPSLLAAKLISPPVRRTCGLLGGHHVIADRPGGPQARSSPSARQGRSEAKWLDGDEDRRTIRARDGRSERLRGRSAARTYDTNETRRLEEEVGEARRRSQVWSQCECAFNYMNTASGKNLTSVFLSMKSAWVCRTTPAAHSAASRTKRGCAGRQRHASGA